MSRALIGLGSNLGDRAAILDSALRQLDSPPEIKLLRTSRILATRPIGGPPGQPDFLNAAALIDCTLSPVELLKRLHHIEAQFGRTREVRWDERTLDLDLLLYDDLIWNSSELTLPHPRLAWRGFALFPAAEVAPGWRHPVIGWTLEELARHLRFAPNYLAISGGIQPSTRVAARRLARELAPPQSTAKPSQVPAFLFPGTWNVPRGPNSESKSPQGESHPPPGLRSLQTQAQDLSQALTTHWASFPGSHWMISDFWLPDLLLPFPEETAPLQQNLPLPDAYLEALASVATPKLLIWLEEAPKPQPDGASPRRQADPSEDMPRTGLLRNFHRGPRLVGQIDSWPELLTEAQAALEAMHNQPRNPLDTPPNGN
jgi:2-amino-4-hydroxy-6-hydroxymethyldihydropteridine diphosphokinase